MTDIGEPKKSPRVARRPKHGATHRTPPQNKDNDNNNKKMPTAPNARASQKAARARENPVRRTLFVDDEGGVNTDRLVSVPVDDVKWTPPDIPSVARRASPKARSVRVRKPRAVPKASTNASAKPKPQAEAEQEPVAYASMMASIKYLFRFTDFSEVMLFIWCAFLTLVMWWTMPAAIEVAIETMDFFLGPGYMPRHANDSNTTAENMTV